MTELPTTFGLEIEFCGGDVDGIHKALRKAQLFGWRVKRDVSCGYELVTPILGLVGDFERVKTAVDILKSHGAKINSNCGLHVHVGVQGLSFKTVRRIIGFFLRHETTFLALAPGRAGNKYCAPVEDKAQAKREGSDYWDDDLNSRRTWINGQAHRRYNTLEFRLMEGTLDADLMRGWAFLLVAAVSAAGTRRVRVNGSSSVESLARSCRLYRCQGVDPDYWRLLAKEWLFERSKSHVAAQETVLTPERDWAATILTSLEILSEWTTSVTRQSTMPLTSVYSFDATALSDCVSLSDSSS